nr:unnamed protein product [Spirometra erinaceieuropaei]
MVEWFHRHLKASLRSAADPQNWMDHIPLVLLGIRSALKPDIDCSAAELVFGTTVRLPVEDSTNLEHHLRQFMRTLPPVLPSSSASPSYLAKDLATCSHVHVRCDRVHRPLELPYDGPFRVFSRRSKTFLIQRDNREEVVSVDRLKAVLPDTPPDEPCGTLPSAHKSTPIERQKFLIVGPIGMRRAQTNCRYKQRCEFQELVNHKKKRSLEQGLYSPDVWILT